jgi:hypothetical protein
VGLVLPQLQQQTHEYFTNEHNTAVTLASKKPDNTAFRLKIQVFWDVVLRCWIFPTVPLPSALSSQRRILQFDIQRTERRDIFL